MSEGFTLPSHCPRGRNDCEAYSQIISSGHESFICCGRNDGTTRAKEQDKFRLCLKNESDDVMHDVDLRDLAHQASVITQAMAIISEIHQIEPEEGK